jgi:hypothetical protein
MAKVTVAVSIQETLELIRSFLFRDSVPLLDSAAELLPIAFKTFPVHIDLLLLRMPAPDVAGQRGGNTTRGSMGLSRSLSQFCKLVLCWTAIGRRARRRTAKTAAPPVAVNASIKFMLEVMAS